MVCGAGGKEFFISDFATGESPIGFIFFFFIFMMVIGKQRPLQYSRWFSPRRAVMSSPDIYREHLGLSNVDF
jgi:hypothetical protein